MKPLCPHPAKCPVHLWSQLFIQSHPITRNFKKKKKGTATATAANEFQGVKSTWRLKKFPTPSSVSQLSSMPSSGCQCPAGTAVVTTTRAHVTAKQMKTPAHVRSHDVCTSLAIRKNLWVSVCMHLCVCWVTTCPLAVVSILAVSSYADQSMVMVCDTPLSSSCVCACVFFCFMWNLHGFRFYVH